MEDQAVLDLLKKNLYLPKGEKICKDAMNLVLGNKKSNKSWIKKNFSDIVEKVQSEAYRLYLEAEKPAAIAAFRKTFGPLLKKDATAEDFFRLIENNFFALDKFFLSLTQGRRPRAGNAFEYVIKVLFQELNYPYSAHPTINGKPDFLLPHKKHFYDSAMDCIIFTVKRTLRERWRQIITEGTRGHLFFLATIDDGLKQNDLDQMNENRIYLVVPDSVKNEHYSKQKNVISFESFFRHHLDPAMKRWKENNII